jgi:demethylmenaquinone methyltransferase / 2-methoxy-6-polyprenyl-1,4-benzoquinol methylase
MVKPYSAEGSKTQQISSMFDNIAKHYDFLNHFLTLGIDKIWRRKMIAELVEVQPKRVLDVATGTADVAINTIKQLKIKDLKIVGVDISNEMLNVGRKKLVTEGVNDVIDLQLADSENLPFQSNNFDAVTVAYGVRNFENLEQGLAEMHRVLNANGKIVVLEFSRPRIFPFRQLFNFYFKNILPTIGKFTSKDAHAYSYLYESVQAFPDGDDFLTVLNKVGFKNTSCTTLTLGICSLYIGYKK